MIPFDPKNIEHCDSLEYFIHYSRYPEYYYFDRMEYLNDGFRQYVGKHLNLLTKILLIIILISGKILLASMITILILEFGLVINSFPLIKK